MKKDIIKKINIISDKVKDAIPEINKFKRIEARLICLEGLNALLAFVVLFGVIHAFFKGTVSKIFFTISSIIYIIVSVNLIKETWKNVEKYMSKYSV